MDRFSFIVLYVEAIQDYLHRKFYNHQYFSTKYRNDFLMFKYNQLYGTTGHILIGLHKNGNMVIGSELYDYNSKNGDEIKYIIENVIKLYFKHYKVHYNIDLDNFDNEVNKFIYDRIKQFSPTNDKEKFEILKLINEWKNRCKIKDLDNIDISFR